MKQWYLLIKFDLLNLSKIKGHDCYLKVMLVSFKETFRAVYQWQKRHYEVKIAVETKVVAPVTMKPMLVSNKKTQSSLHIPFRVVKRDHPLLTQLSIRESNFKDTYKQCTRLHMEMLISYIDLNDERGMSMNDIFDLLIASDNSIDGEIMLNVETMFYWLIQLGILINVIEKDHLTPSVVSEAKIKEGPIRYKLFGIREGLDGNVFEKQVKKLLSKADEKELPVGCRVGHLERLLYYMDSASEDGKSTDDIIKDMQIGSPICVEIANNAEQMIQYCVKVGMLCTV